MALFGSGRRDSDRTRPGRWEQARRGLAEFRTFAPTRSWSCKGNVSRSMIAKTFVISVRLKHRRSRVQPDQKDRKHQILLPSGRIFSAIGRMISDWRCDGAFRRRKRRTHRRRLPTPRSARAFRADFGRLNRVAPLATRDNKGATTKGALPERRRRGRPLAAAPDVGIPRRKRRRPAAWRSYFRSLRGLYGRSCFHLRIRSSSSRSSFSGSAMRTVA